MMEQKTMIRWKRGEGTGRMLVWQEDCIMTYSGQNGMTGVALYILSEAPNGMSSFRLLWY